MPWHASSASAYEGPPGMSEGPPGLDSTQDYSSQQNYSNSGQTSAAPWQQQQNSYVAPQQGYPSYAQTSNQAFNQSSYPNNSYQQQQQPHPPSNAQDSNASNSYYYNNSYNNNQPGGHYSYGQNHGASS